MSAGNDASAGAGAPRAVRDVVLTAVLAALLLVVVAGAALLGLLLALVGDSCGVVQCRSEQLTAGVIVAAAGPVVVGILAVIALVRRLVRRRSAFWVPLIGLVLVALVWLCGAALAVAAVPGFTV